MKKSSALSNVRVLSHPLIEHKLTLLRDRQTSSQDFRKLLSELSGLMAFEVTRLVKTRKVSVRTPLRRASGVKALQEDFTVVGILRAGLGMMDGILHLVPGAKIGHIGLYRDPVRLRPVRYYHNLPKKLSRGWTVLVDPMLATGYSAAEAVRILKEAGAEKICFMSLIATPEGASVLKENHPDVLIYTACVDPKLDSKGYILPGLGDAGDRLFNT